MTLYEVEFTTLRQLDVFPPGVRFKRVYAPDPASAARKVGAFFDVQTNGPSLRIDRVYEPDPSRVQIPGA